MATLQVEAFPDTPHPEPRPLLSLDETWALWPTAVLRGAGFPAATLLRLAAPSLAAAADRLLDREEETAARQEALGRELQAALDEVHRAGEEFDRERHFLLLRAVRALHKGKHPAELPDGPLREAAVALDGLRAAGARGRQELSAVHAEAVAGLSAELERIASWDLFREAVVWQNRETVELALDGLRPAPEGDAARNSRRRQREEMVASYLQRYCAKNDTIGFFGPVGWAELSPDGPAVSLRTGPALLARREVYFETWCLEALAERLARDLPLRPWLAPRLRRGLALDGGRLRGPGRKPIPLDPARARLLAACDGERTAAALAAALVTEPAAPFGTVEEVYAALAALADEGLVVWTLEVPFALYPERTLRRVLAGVGAPDLRARALAALDELESCRERVARAAGDAAALESAMAELETSFERLTGAAPRRHHGRLYAARGLVYEECRRDVEMRLGPQLLEGVAAPLSLVLDSARWLTAELTRRFDERLAEIHDAMYAQDSAAPVDSLPFFQRVFQAVFAQARNEPFLAAARREFRERWARVLALDPAAEPTRAERTTAGLRSRFDAEFAARGPSWGLVRYFSPDLLIAARDEAALRTGDFQVVLGEIHPTNTLSWSCFLTQHPDPEEVLRWIERDLGGTGGAGGGGQPFLVPQFPRSRWTQRMNVQLVLPHFLRYEIAEQGAVHPPCRSLPAGAAIVREVDGRVRVESRDGRLHFPAHELFALLLTEQCSHILGSLLPASPHRPRVAIDGLVVARETWDFPLPATEIAGLQDAAERFLAVRRWARRHGLPRFCFYKVPQERKPCYLDLDSPIYVDLFAKLVRAAGKGVGEPAELTVSEMLPDLGQAWLPDASGQRYTCELRLAAIDNPGR